MHCVVRTATVSGSPRLACQKDQEDQMHQSLSYHENTDRTHHENIDRTYHEYTDRTHHEYTYRIYNEYTERQTGHTTNTQTRRPAARSGLHFILFFKFKQGSRLCRFIIHYRWKVLQSLSVNTKPLHMILM